MAALMHSEMEAVGRKLSGWQAEFRMVLWAAGIGACLAMFGLSDIFMQFGRSGRVISWLVLIALAGLAFWTISKALGQRRTVLGVAATIERAFPSLDNHLINYIQFGAATDNDAFKKAYVRRGIPEWRSVNVDQMKNRKAALYANLGLLLAVLLLVTPGILAGQTWVVSIWRIVNPFSNTPPVSLTNILNVDPGDAVLLQGNPVMLACSVKGRRNHRVWLDIEPADNERTTYDLGKITSGDIETNVYRVPKLTTDMKYRFRAGDSPFPKWYKIEARPPLAFTKIQLSVAPPDYTRLNPRTFDGMGEPVQIFQGSEMEMTVTFNQPVTNTTVFLKGQTPIQLTKTADGKVWRGKTAIMSGSGLQVMARNQYDEQVDVPVAYELMPDREPVIQVLAPKGKTVLEDGGIPSVQFSVQDDYGLKEIWVEQVPAGSIKGTVGQVIDKWPVADFAFSKDWKAPNLKMGKGEPIVLRIVAKDNYPFGERRTQSSAVVFDPLNVKSALEKEAAAMAAAAASLGKIVELQKQNVAETTKLKDAIAVAPPEQWGLVANVQDQIRQLTGKILQNPLNPLGGMTAGIKQLYADEMSTAVSQLKETAGAKGDEKTKLADSSLTTEETILKKLTYAEVASAKSKTSRKASGLVAMLKNLIKGESKVLSSTQNYIQTKVAVGKPVVEQQDGLAADVTAFVKACQEDAQALEGSDKKFSEMITKAAAACEEKAIKQDMLKSAEELDANAPDKAVPLQETSLAKLREISQMMNQWQVANAENRLEEVIDTVQETRDKMDKLSKLAGKVVESMLLTEKSKDRQDKAMDLMEEEAKELRQNMKDALLQVPTDLQIFPELSVANEMVDDVITGFEEVDQVAGSDKWGADKAFEIATLKPESMIDQMKKAKDRIDALDMWLPDEPDTLKSTTESFDREEMPKKMALGALPSAAEDLVGDLLKEAEELEKAAQDSATNQGAPDVEPGWEMAEGNLESFGAQGKSGNQVPDHKEQAGRGNMGRQGMANGEAAASSGQIGEGDKNIEERITPDPLQAGQVQADGEADTKATGGGKLGSGSADGVGMGGGGKDRRMDATAEGSAAGLEALMAKTDATYVKASLLNLRVDSLATAAHNIRQASDAVAAGLPISQVREYERRAIGELRKAKTELASGVSDTVEQDEQPNVLEDVVDGGADLIPANYRDLVSEYYRSLNQAQ